MSVCFRYILLFNVIILICFMLCWRIKYDDDDDDRPTDRDYVKC